MADITAILVAGGLCIAGVEAWYATWRRRVAASLTPASVSGDRSALAVRREAGHPTNTR